jgi:hypothetical protein
VTPVQRASAQLDAIGAEPPWWRPLKRRAWRIKAVVLLADLYVAIAIESAAFKAAQAVLLKAFQQALVPHELGTGGRVVN